MNSQRCRHTIYALIDRTDDTIRYIGRTTNPEKRLAAHRRGARGMSLDLNAWATSTPIALIPIEIVVGTAKDAENHEREWIYRVLTGGYHLYNRQHCPEGLSAFLASQRFR